MRPNSRVNALQDSKARPTAAQLEHHKLVVSIRRKATPPQLLPLILKAQKFLATKAAVSADLLATQQETLPCASA